MKLCNEIVVGLCAMAGSFAWAELPAPVDGVITIPENETVTVADSGEAATLAGATGLVLSEGSTLVYTCTDALALSANVSGTGTFRAESSGTVTLSGDNQNLLSPGHFEFIEACAAVTSEHGLGSSGTATATFNHTSVQKCVSFGGTTGVLTNYVGLSYLSKTDHTIGSRGRRCDVRAGGGLLHERERRILHSIRLQRLLYRGHVHP